MLILIAVLVLALIFVQVWNKRVQRERKRRIDLSELADELHEKKKSGEE